MRKERHVKAKNQKGEESKRLLHQKLFGITTSNIFKISFIGVHNTALKMGYYVAFAFIFLILVLYGIGCYWLLDITVFAGGLILCYVLYFAHIKQLYYHPPE